jgi:hypothetical protein
MFSSNSRQLRTIEPIRAYTNAYTNLSQSL